MMERKMHGFANLATKDQIIALEKSIAGLEKSTNDQIISLKKSTNDQFEVVKAELKAEIANIKYDLLKWIIPFLIGIIIAIITK